jgi:hypothetical protein
MSPLPRLSLNHRRLSRHLLIGIAGISAACAAPVPITGAGSYSQNFDTLPSTGTTNAWTNDTTIAGWYSQRTGTGTTIAADTGAGTGGGLYSYGATASSERALGTLGSGNAAAGSFAHGVLLQNTSGGSVTINSLGYIGEEWRKAGVTTAQVVTLWYKISSTAITSLDPIATSDVGWTAVPAGDFSSPVNTATAGALNGNDAANRTVISINPNINIPDQNYVMLRWKDPDHTGTDHGLAIDDVSLAWVVNATPALTLSADPTNFIENAGATASTGTVTIPAALDADLTVNLASSDITEATVPATVTIVTGNTSATFPIAAVNDLVDDGLQNVTLTASASGYINGQAGLAVDDDTDGPIAVTVVPTSFSEAAAPGSVTGTVALAEVTPVDVMVSLTSNDITEATVPESVTIPANQSSVTFEVTAVQDTELDGNKTFRINATSAEYTPGFTTITVTDDEVPVTPTLTPGAIAFTGFNADGNDDLAFVALVPIPSGETIFFTDNAWNGGALGDGGAFATTEGVAVWTAPVGGVAAGNVVTLNSLSVTARTASVGTITATINFALSASGEAVYAYQGTAATTPSSILAVIATNSDSTVGTGLSPDHIIVLVASTDIAAFVGSRSNKTSYAGYLASLATAANWESQNTSPDNSVDIIAPDLPFDTTAFTLAPPSAYGTWAGLHAGGGTPAEDFDKDGVRNGVEYFMGSPDGFTANPVPVGGKITWPHSDSAPEATFKVFISENLSTWTDVTADATDAGGKVEYTLPKTTLTRFIRLEVTVMP